MAQSRMKPESLEEQKDRLLAMSEAEKRGFAAATEGQIIGQRGSPADPDGPEQAILERHQALRLERSANDLTDDEAVDWQTEAFANADKAAEKARHERRAKASRKGKAHGPKAE